MEITALIVGVSVALLVVIVIFAARVKQNHQRNRDIAESLDTIRNAVELNRAKGINAPDINVEPAFEKLRLLAADTSPEVNTLLKDMQDRCQEIERRVGEFKAQETIATLQSSLTTGKTDKLVIEIHDLAHQVELALGYRPKKS